MTYTMLVIPCFLVVAIVIVIVVVVVVVVKAIWIRLLCANLKGIKFAYLLR